MRRLLARTLVAALVTAALPVLAAPAAQASSCPLFVDVLGDGASPLLPALRSDQLDIVSGDVASGATSVVAVLRLKSLAPDTVTTFGGVWAVRWTINGNQYSVSVRRDVHGEYAALFLGGSAGVLPGVTIDVANATITWTLPRTALPDLATAGQTFSGIAATTYLMLGTVYTNADEAVTSQTYVDQTAGCVAAS
jgi:hypothetical protein